MDVDKKVELLQDLIDDIPLVRFEGRESVKFKTWKKQCGLIIKEIFKDEPRYLLNFEDISYDVSFCEENDNEAELDTAFEKGLQEANYILRDYIKNIKNFEVDKQLMVKNKKLLVHIKKSKKVFVVHGREEALKQKVARYLEKLRLETVILDEEANEGNTIIEKIEANTDVGYAVVLYTPCDIGGLKGSKYEDLQDRARQNVVFEHGYLIGKLGRKNVAALVKGNVEILSDISGIAYIKADSEEWEVKLGKELVAAGYDIDFNLIYK